jgi:aminoglycoside phosphotransferase (APT) family kinase protein
LAQIVRLGDFLDDLANSDTVENQEGKRDNDVNNNQRRRNVESKRISKTADENNNSDEQDAEDEEKWLESRQKWVNFQRRVCYGFVPV